MVIWRITIKIIICNKFQTVNFSATKTVCNKFLLFQLPTLIFCFSNTSKIGQVSTVASEKLANNPLKDPFYVTGCLCPFKDLSFIFNSLIMVLVSDFFDFILLGVIYFHPHREGFCHYIFKYPIFLSLLSFPSRTPIMCILVGMLVSLSLCSLFFFLFLSVFQTG